jgi:hypothetical protein
VSFGQRGGEEVTHTDCWRKSIAGLRNSQGKPLRPEYTYNTCRRIRRAMWLDENNKD